MEIRNAFQLERVAIRMVKEPPLYSDVPMNNPQAVVKLLADTFKDYDREVFAVVNLRADLKPINLNIVSIGALDYAVAHPREILKSSILSNASSIMMVHNHPSGNLTPSREDIQLTDRISKICNLLGIKLTDHLIVGPGQEYYSFHENSRMPVASLVLASSPTEIGMEGLKVAEATAEIQKEDQKEKAKATGKRKQTEVTLTVAECSEFHSMGELHEDIKTVKEAVELFGQIPPERMHGIPAIGVRVTDMSEPELFTEIDVVTHKTVDLEMLSYVPEIARDWKAQQVIAELIHAFPEAEIRGEISPEIQKKVQVIESREKQAAQLEDVTTKLEQGVKEVFDSEKYKGFLSVMAKMPRYSLNNQILIAMQTKGKATMCQSFTGWKEMGRFVKKGEKGIKIFAPAPYTIQKEMVKLDQNTGRPVMDADGEPVKETKEITVNAFKVVSTFDLSQTDGKEIPSLTVPELTGNVEAYQTLFQALQEVCPVPIGFEQIETGAKGYFHQTEKRIAIQEGMSEVQTIKTAIHEMAHQKIHDKDAVEAADKLTTNQKEVEAESVAFVVCSHLGIDTGEDYSFGYIAGWSEGKETPELKASLGKIRETAADMITAIDEKVEQIRGMEKDAEKQVDPFVSELADKITKSAEEKGFIKIVPDKEEPIQGKKKISVKQKIKEGQAKEKQTTEKEKKTPGRKPRASKAKEERV